MKTQLKSLTLAAFAATTLAACGGGDDGGNATETSIAVFTVSGTSSTPAGGATPINSGVGGGSFQISANANAATSVMHIRFFVSKNDSLDTSVDKQFFSRNCSSAHTCSKGSTNIFNCTFNSSNEISCEGDAATDLTSYFASLPEQGYILMNACDGTFTDCKTASQLVEFQ